MFSLDEALNTPIGKLSGWRLDLRCSPCDRVAPYVIRWGPNATSERLRQSAVCQKCGGRGALTYHPSWGGSHIGWMAFPVLSSAE